MRVTFKSRRDRTQVGTGVPVPTLRSPWQDLETSGDGPWKYSISVADSSHSNELVATGHCSFVNHDAAASYCHRRIVIISAADLVVVNEPPGPVILIRKRSTLSPPGKSPSMAESMNP